MYNNIFSSPKESMSNIEFLGHKWSLSSYKTGIITLLTSVELQIKV